MRIRLDQLLVIIFVIAKVCGKFDYSWWIVFSPIIFGIIISTIDSIVNKKK